VPAIEIVVADPTAFQVVPSEERKAWKILFVRVTRTQYGTVPVPVEFALEPLVADRYWNVAPFP
jgi:hypothetical protein